MILDGRGVKPIFAEADEKIILECLEIEPCSLRKLDAMVIERSGKTASLVPHDGIARTTSGYAASGLDHKSAKGRPAHVGLRAQGHVLQGSGDAGTEQGGRNYDQGPHLPLTPRLPLMPMASATKRTTNSEEWVLRLSMTRCNCSSAGHAAKIGG